MSNYPEEHKNNAQYQQAKRQGYRARSAFKLFDIQKRYNIFKRVFYILDLGSAPGSWLQVAKKFAVENLDKYHDKYYKRDHFRIMGVDIKKISAIDGVKIVRMDFTKNEFQKEINLYFRGENLDLILSDASIRKSGNKFSDQAKQFDLCYKILEYTKFLKKNGNIVIKVFQGADYDKFYQFIKKKFIFVKSLKPGATKKKSNEIYIIGLKRR